MTINKKIRLDNYLKDYLLDATGKPEFSRVEIQNFIKQGAILVNDIVINKPSANITQNDNIKINTNIINDFVKNKISSNDLKPKKIDIKIVFENQNLIIIDKQAGLNVHPGAGNVNDTLVNGLLYLQNNNKLTLSNERGEKRLGIVHRLDKDTSGLMIVAKNNKIHRLLADLIKEHSIERKYLALCHGIPVPSFGKIETFICRDKKNIEKMQICPEDALKAKKAITNYKIISTFTYDELKKNSMEWQEKCIKNNELEFYKTGDFFRFLLKKYNNININANNNEQMYSLIECKLQTGRTHQIRLHMQYIKHPLVGEKIYTASNLIKSDTSLGFYRQMLHSYRLNFQEPITNETIDIEL